MSSTYRARPVTLSGPSLRGTGLPTVGDVLKGWALVRAAECAAFIVAEDHRVLQGNYGSGEGLAAPALATASRSRESAMVEDALASQIGLADATRQRSTEIRRDCVPMVQPVGGNRRPAVAFKDD